MIVDPKDVMAGAPDDAPQVVVISRYENGRLAVGSSHPAADAIAAMNEAREWIEAGCPEQ
jgi:hypothetical protein